ncbi:MAG: hypothetical protein GX477_09925 [Clostridiaceae bacterium]|jgi:predicted RNA methylase|nr:hypothetical protein [Clostridiaceae bacterium]
MEYKYSNDDNFEDFACGRVLYHRSGMPCFPVRLADEIFKRCMEHLGRQNDIVLFDPCCGGGYMAAVLGLLNPAAIRKIVCSDIDEEAVGLARSNLSLLTMDGLLRRREQIVEMIGAFGKQSHKDTLKSADRFIRILQDRPFVPDIKCFVADALDKTAFCNMDLIADIVIADVPYGNLSTWSGRKADAVDLLLDSIKCVIDENSITAVVCDKSQKVRNSSYKRLERFKAGKRVVEILKLVQA